ERGFSHLPQIRAALLYGSTAQLLATPEKLTLADDLQVILLYSADTPAEEIDLRCGLGELVGDLRGRPLGITCNVHLENMVALLSGAESGVGPSMYRHLFYMGGRKDALTLGKKNPVSYLQPTWLDHSKPTVQNLFYRQGMEFLAARESVLSGLFTRGGDTSSERYNALSDVLSGPVRLARQACEAWKGVQAFPRGDTADQVAHMYRQLVEKKGLPQLADELDRFIGLKQQYVERVKPLFKEGKHRYHVFPSTKTRDMYRQILTETIHSNLESYVSFIRGNRILFMR
ncbi:MAG TPA: hypothetical protein VLA04_00855, partial [Verrucomicrobiae bacterium]|nr:hypothetical protein [Verrucomicrobiae bacterium]